MKPTQFLGLTLIQHDLHAGEDDKHSFPVEYMAAIFVLSLGTFEFGSVQKEKPKK